MHCESSNTEFNHYALKEAKRAYAPGEQIANNDYRIVKILNNYTYSVIDDGYTNSLSEHTFSTNDGDSIVANVSVGTQNIPYRITLNPLASCSTGEVTLSTTGISSNKPNEDQNVTFDGIDFIFNFNTTYVRNISTGGITFGSGNNSLTKLTIKTKNSYKINAAYIKAFVGNVNSSYRLTIKVGDATILNSTSVDNKDVAKVYGASKNTTLEGQLSYIFEGSSSLKINSVAFNIINA